MNGIVFYSIDSNKEKPAGHIGLVLDENFND